MKTVFGPDPAFVATRSNRFAFRPSGLQSRGMLLCFLFGHKWGEWQTSQRKYVAEQRGWDSLPYWMMIDYRERGCLRCRRSEEGKV